jgi:hypothetical protein
LGSDYAPEDSPLVGGEIQNEAKKCFISNLQSLGMLANVSLTWADDASIICSLSLTPWDSLAGIENDWLILLPALIPASPF